MGILLTISTVYIPEFIRKRKLEILFKATADAFCTAVPPSSGLSYSESLKLYAQFTRERADISIQNGNVMETQSRLFQNALLIGRQFRSDFNINTPEDVMRLSRLIYKVLKIDFKGSPEGNIMIGRCFFSDYYSSRVCQLISYLDEGLLVGLAGGGQLSFSQRITEGNKCCQAYLVSGRLR